MKSFKVFTESIIDLPRKDYSKTVFDDYDTEKPKLKPFIKKIIQDQIKSFATKYAPVIKYRLIGSILTKRYRKDADLDINVLFDVPEAEREEEGLKIREALAKINGEFVPDTIHPINYFTLVDVPTYEKANQMADDVYDIVNDKFEKRTKPKPFDVDDYMDEFKNTVQKLDFTKGELKRDLIDYNELKELDKDDIANLYSKLRGKRKELEDDINTLLDIKGDILADRKSAFTDDMTPDQIKKHGVRNRLPQNVIYKMLEKYYYFDFLKKLKEIIGDDRKLSGREIKQLRSVGEALDKGNTLVFAFGRFNPPTVGHAKLMREVNLQARRNNANHIVYASASTDKRSNPLDVKTKVKFMKKMFPGNKIQAAGGTQRTFMEILKFYNKMYGEIIMVAGSDRESEFQKLADKYNGKDYNYKSIRVVTSGVRDPDAEGVTGMSASKMREMAKQDDYRSFKLGVTNLSDSDTKA